MQQAIFTLPYISSSSYSNYYYYYYYINLFFCTVDVIM